MKIRRLLTTSYALLISISPLAVISPASAAADVCTWTGAASNDNFSQIDNPGVSQTTNWNCSIDGDNTVPDPSGDSLQLDSSIASVVTNDIPNLSVADISFIGTATFGTYINGASVITVTGNITSSSSAMTKIFSPVQFTGSSTINTGAGGIEFSNVVSGSGAITKTGTGELVLGGNGDNTFTGTLNVNAGYVTAKSTTGLGASSAATTISNGASVDYSLSGTTDQTISEPFTIAGTGNSPSSCALSANLISSLSTAMVIFTGNITLTADTAICPEYDGQTKLTGALSGNFKISVPQGRPGSLIIDGSSNTTQTSNGTYQAPKVETAVSDSQPTTPIFVGYNETVILNGERGDVNVGKGGILKGNNGKMSSLFVDTGGKVAPGLSPGCLNTGATTINGSFDVEIGGTTACSGYDQLKVTGTVDVTGGTLNTSLYGGFVPAVGQAYTIIDNDSNDAVTGTFTGLAQGASITNQGVTYSISYTGGDGNDVVLTVTAVDAAALPGTPNTGLSLLFAHPVITLVLTTAAAAGLFMAARRYGYVTAKIRK